MANNLKMLIGKFFAIDKSGSPDSNEPTNQCSEPTLKRPFYYQHALLIMALALTSLVYLETINFQFVYDDISQIRENKHLRSWEYIPQYFTDHTWSHIFQVGNYYRPIFLLWLLINYSLFEQNPMGWHITTILVHLVAVVLVYVLINRISRDRILAGIATLIFALHPTHIESVAWISGVTDPLLLVFLASSFLCYLNKLDNSKKYPNLWWITSLIFYSIAIFEKETAIIFPVILLYFTLKFQLTNEATKHEVNYRRWQSALLLISPYLLISGVYLIVRFIVLNGLSHKTVILSNTTIIYTAPTILWGYTKLLMWPFGLSAFYDTPYITSPRSMSFLLSTLGIIGLGIGLWYWSRQNKLIGLASVWLIVPLLPLLNISVFHEGEILHDRYLYVPSVGFSIIMAIAIRSINIGSRNLLALPAAQTIALISITCLLTLGVLSQTLPWSSDLKLFSHGLRIAPQNNLAAIFLCNHLAERGEYDVAIKLCEEVLKRKPNNWHANYNLGHIYYKMDQLKEAEFYLNKANMLEPNNFKSQRMWGLTLLKMGQLDAAEASIRHAMKMPQVELEGYHFVLGTILKQKGDLEGALREFKLELDIDPKDEAARKELKELSASLKPMAL
jgi:protein O-mannosyl-transferase